MKLHKQSTNALSRLEAPRRGGGPPLLLCGTEMLRLAVPDGNHHCAGDRDLHNLGSGLSDEDRLMMDGY